MSEIESYEIPASESVGTKVESKSKSNSVMNLNINPDSNDNKTATNFLLNSPAESFQKMFDEGLIITSVPQPSLKSVDVHMRHPRFCAQYQNWYRIREAQHKRRLEILEAQKLRRDEKVAQLRGFVDSVTSSITDRTSNGPGEHDNLILSDDQSSRISTPVKNSCTDRARMSLRASSPASPYYFAEGSYFSMSHNDHSQSYIIRSTAKSTAFHVPLGSPKKSPSPSKLHRPASRCLGARLRSEDDGDRITTDDSANVTIDSQSSCLANSRRRSSPKLTAMNSEKNTSFQDLDSSISSTVSKSDSVGKRTSSGRKVQDLKKFRNKIMLSEWMIDRPDNFETEWIFKTVPIGKRCLIVSSKGETVAYSRTGTFLKSFQSQLPGGHQRNDLESKGKSINDCTILDCIHENVRNVFYILDIITWNDVKLYESEAEFRFYWLESRFEEFRLKLTSINSQNECQFYPLPAHEATDDQILRHRRFHSELNEQQFKGLTVDGFLFFFKTGLYVPGTSPLALWLKPDMIKTVLGIRCRTELSSDSSLSLDDQDDSYSTSLHDSTIQYSDEQNYDDFSSNYENHESMYLNDSDLHNFDPDSSRNNFRSPKPYTNVSNHTEY